MLSRKRKGFKAQLVARTHAYVRNRWPDGSYGPFGTCLYTAGAFIHLASKDPHYKGRRFVLQAGSAFWPRITSEQDDGLPTTNTHFGYKWEGHTPANRLLVAQGLLPEMHAWVGDPVRQVLIDLTTGDLVRQCDTLIQEDWPGIQPPDFFWGGPADLPDDVAYEPDGEATFLALDLLKRALAESR